VTLFPAIFALRNSRVHVSTSDNSNIFTNIDALVDEAFGPATTLNIPNVYPNDKYI